MEDDWRSKSPEKQKQGWERASGREGGSVREKSPTPIVTKWATADVFRDENNTYILYAMRDLALFVIYFTTLLLVLVGYQAQAHHYYASVVEDLLAKSKFECSIGELKTEETFETMRAVQHVWCYIEQVLVPFFYDDNGTTRWVMTENVKVGAPEILQIRVKNGTCPSPVMFADLYKTCYDYYSEGNADGDPFGDGIAFRWQPNTIDIAPNMLTHGERKIPGGYQFNFSTQYNLTHSWLQELKNKSWIRPGVRYIVVDFALFTPSSNLFLIVKLDFLLFPAGGVLTNRGSYTWKVHRFVDVWDFFILSCEIIIVVFTVYFTFEELSQMRILGSQYLSNLWNILDLLIIIFSYAALATAWWRFFLVKKSIAKKIALIGTSEHLRVDEFIGLQSLLVSLTSGVLFLASLKIFKFTTLFKSVTLILTSVERVIPELTIMLLQTTFMSAGFALLGQELFGHHSIQFSTATSSFFSIIGIYVGRMHFYHECTKAYPVIAPFYFGSYIIFVCMVHLNAFVGLMVHGYREARNLLNEDPTRQYMGDLMYNVLVHVLDRLGSDRTLRRILTKDIVHRRQKDFDELVAILKRHGYRGLELRLLLGRYEIHRGDEMSFETFAAIYNDALLRNQLKVETEGHDNVIEVVGNTERLLTSCETDMINIQQKVDIILDRLLSDPSKQSLKKIVKPRKGSRKFKQFF